MKVKTPLVKEGNRIGDYFRALPYQPFELTLFDADFQSFNRGKYSRQVGMTMRQIMKIEDLKN